MMSKEILFENGKLGKIEVKNRTIVAPMTRISGTSNGDVGPLMTDYYTAFGLGGFGAIITEGVYTDKEYSQGYINQPGITDEKQAASWAELIENVHQTNAKIIIQLMHAGALSQFNRFSAKTGGPSAIIPKGEQMGFYHGEGSYKKPIEMSVKDIEVAVNGFVDSAKRSQDAGADGVEIHGANGYLFDQFLTEYTNQRNDLYGGSIINRIRLTCEVVERVRAVVGGEFTVGVRISQAKVNDYEYKWSGGAEDAKVVFEQLAKSGASYIHTTEFEAFKPAFGEGQSLSALAKEISKLPVIANGSLETVEKASDMIHNKEADFVAIGKGALAAPDWANKIRNGEKIPDFDFGLLSPFADLKTALEFSKKNND